LTAQDVNEIAETPAGALRDSFAKLRAAESEAPKQESALPPLPSTQPKLSTASVNRDGKVTFGTSPNPTPTGA
jgi:hypothetical protein